MVKFLVSAAVVASVAFSADYFNVIGAATSTKVNVGYKPSYTKVINKTTNVVWENFQKFDGAGDLNYTVITTGATGVITYGSGTGVTVGSFTSGGKTFYGVSIGSSLNDEILVITER